MKKYYYILLTTVFVVSAALPGCSEDSITQTTNEPGSGAGTTLAVTSTTSGILEYDGFRMEVHTGDVPKLTSGNPGTVTFSLNTSAAPESGVQPVPSGYTVIGKYLKAGPESFNFAGAIGLFFPAESQPSPQDLVVMQYSAELQQWKIVPVSAIDTANKKVGIGALKLGYYVLTKRNSSFDSDFRAGGCVLDIPMEPFTKYLLTCSSVSPEKPEILNLYDGGLVGKTFLGPIFLGCQQGPTKAIVPQGSISFFVSKISCVDANPQIFTYSIPATVTIAEPLNFIGWSTYDAVTYVPFTLPTGGSWVAGRPSNWPPPTQPFGTGTVQATLTWNNGSSNAADLDLHLYGPNNLHISWQNTSSANFQLDRDWQSTPGDAIENIFSTTTTVPSGDYRVNVAFFSGFAKSFNCRVIVNGNVTNFSSNLGGGSVDVRTFSIP